MSRPSSARSLAAATSALPLLLACGGAQQPAAAAGARPPLVVMVSVDQLATWVFEAGLPHCREDGGFKRLLREGTYFTKCAYLHGCTETGPGHATLGTGAPARAHGIVKNQWFDPQTGATVYCAGDATAAALAAFPEGAGRSAARLLVPTLGDWLQRHVGDAAEVVSISLKDRSAILMGGRRADAAVWFQTATGRFVTNRSWGEQAPAWLLAFDAKRPADAAFGWTWDRFASAAAYADCEDVRPFELPHPSSGERTLPVVLTGGRDEPTAAYYGEVYYSPLGNELVLQAALAALAGTGLGRDAVPDLLCVSFSANDTVGHAFGPDSVEARDTLLRLDEQLARLLTALDARVGEGRYVVTLCADHGVALPPEVARAKGLGGGRGIFHLRAKAAAQRALRDHLGADGDFVRQASERSVYLDQDAIVAAAGAGAGDRAAVLAAARRVVAAAVVEVPGIDRAEVVSELVAAAPDPADPIQSAMWNAVHPDRVGDVLMVFAPYWIEGTIAATHGSPHEYDRAVPLLAMGPGIAAGLRSDAAVSPGLGAVLAAHLCGVPPLAAAVDRVPDGVLVGDRPR